MGQAEQTFDTALGPVSICRSLAGVSSVSLLGTARARGRAAGESAAGESVAGGSVAGRRAGLAGRIRRHMAGDLQDFLDVRLDWRGVAPFARKVYEELRRVPAGQTVTYAQLAERCGAGRQAARAVARAMATNRFPIVVPCHRVVGALGALCGFSGADGLKTKVQLLFLERAPLPKLPASGLFYSLHEPYAFAIGVRWLRERDRLFGTLHDRVGETAVPREFPGNPFAALAEAVCYQQLAGKAAATIAGRFQNAVGKVTPGNVLRAGREPLRGAGLSSSKTDTILSLADAMQRGRIPADRLAAATSWSDLEEMLSGIKGIGPWTIQMFAIFHLGLPDIFPPGDLGIRKAVGQLVSTRGLLTPERTETIGARWKPFRTIATWYLWRSLGTAMIGD